MKNNLKNIFSKALFFGKKSYKTVLNFGKGYPKASLVFLLLIILMPTITAASNFFSWNTIAYGFLWAISTLITALKEIAVIVMKAAGILFDNMIYITISKDFYDLGWVKLAWGQMRDIANIAFIIGVIIIGFYMMVGREYKKMLLHLIIAAFVMNFSMFVGRVIVDAGNFTSAIFYSMTTIKVKDDAHYFGIARALLGEKTGSKPYFGERSIAAGLVEFANPTRLYDANKFKDLINKEAKVNGNQDPDNMLLKAKIVLDILFIMIMVLFTKVLVQGAFMMISRTIYIIKYLILSPLYFAKYFLPNGAEALYEWFDDIARKAFCLTGYMIGIWMMFLFISAGDMKSSIENLIEGGNFGLFSLAAIVGIKAIILYKALDWLNNYGAKECEDGDALGAGIANKAMGIAKFAGGGALLAGGKMLGLTMARGALAKTGRFIGEKTKDLDKSKWAAARYAGRLGLRAEHWSWNKKIGGKSFNDEVTRTSKENAEIDARHTEEERKEIFYQRMGGDKIKYKDGTRFVGKVQEKEEKEIKEILKKAKEKEKEMRESGKSEKQIADYRKQTADRIKAKREKYLGGKALTKEERIEKAWTKAHKIEGVERGKVGSVMSFLGKAAYIGTGTNLALADVDEANRQYKEKRAIIDLFKAEKDKLKEEEKKATKEYNDERSKTNLEKDKNKSEIELAKKELASSKNIEGLIQKQIRMWNVNLDGVLDLKQMKDAKGDPAKMIELMKETNFGKHLEGIDGKAYADSLAKLQKQENALKEMERDLRKAIDDPDKSQAEIDDLQKQIKSQKKNIEAMASDESITKVVKAFEKIANQKISHINDAADTAHIKAKEDYEKKKSGINRKIQKLDTQEKESQEDLALGRNRRYNTKDNIVSSVGDAEPQL